MIFTKVVQNVSYMMAEIVRKFKIDGSVFLIRQKL